MYGQLIISIEAMIEYNESHLDGRIELETVAEVVHNCLFTETVGMTIHDYMYRCLLTEVTKLLAFFDKPILE